MEITAFSENYTPEAIQFLNGKKSIDDMDRTENVGEAGKMSLLDLFELEESDSDDPETYIVGKPTKNINEAKLKKMIESFLVNHPNQKEKLLELVEKETGLKITL